MKSSQHSSWKEQAAKKYAESQKAIPAEWVLPQPIWDSLQLPLEKHHNNIMDVPRRSGILTDRELQITEYFDVPSLLEQLATGGITAVEAIVAFSKRAAIAQQLMNCLTEMFFDRALARAQELDAMRKKGHLAGALHGLPISLKDPFQVTGIPSTAGFVAYIDHVSDRDANLVQMAYSEGAIFYTADSHNNIFGRTLNPRDTRLTAGGSSGGEGALIAFRGSPLGLGTDVAGSIRIPALCCGTYGFRPTSFRLPYGGQQSICNDAMQYIKASAGPLCNDLGGLEILMKAIIDARPADIDAGVLDVPWRRLAAAPHRKLRLGLLPEDPSFPIASSVKQAMLVAVKTLRAAKHEVVELQPNECRIPDMTELTWAFFGLDTMSSDMVDAAGEPVIPSRLSVVEQIKARPSKFLEISADGDRLDFLTMLQANRTGMTEVWLGIWSKYKLDAIIGPPAPRNAVEHDAFTLPAYMCFLNLLDYPACIMPLGADSGGQAVPASMQIFTRRMRDEECLEVTKVVSKCLDDMRSAQSH